MHTAVAPDENCQLFYLPGCIFCIKVRLVLWWRRIRLPMRNIFLHPEYRDELLAGGGRLQVPCLRIEHNDKVRWLYESDDIIRYLKHSVCA